MSKVLGAKENFRLVVEPRGLGNFGFIRTSDRMIYGTGKEAEERIAREYEARCREIAEQIKRHVDNVSSVHVECDQEAVCEHCGYAWTEKSDTYNGGCCDKDEAAEMARQEEAANTLGGGA